MTTNGRVIALLVTASLAVVTRACFLDWEFSFVGAHDASASGGLGGASDEASTDGPSVDSGGSCPANMVYVGEVSIPFCIDRTEVTRAEYAIFLNEIFADSGLIDLPLHC